MRVYELAQLLKMTNRDLLLKLKAVNIEASSHMSSIDMELVKKLDFENITKYSFADELKNKYKVDIETVKKRYKSEKGFDQKKERYNPKAQNIKFKFDTNEIIECLLKAKHGVGFNSDLFILENYLDVILGFLDSNEKLYEHLFFSKLSEHDFSSEKDLEDFINYRTGFIVSEFNNFKDDDGFNYLKILTQSLFISAYSIFEYRLDEICKKISTTYNYKLKLNDISGKGITRSHKYIKKVIEIDFPDTSESWRNIKNYNEIRNLIVHGQSIVLPDNLKINQIIDKYDGINIVDEKLSLSQFFLHQVFKNITWLLNDVENKVFKKFYHPEKQV